MVIERLAGCVSFVELTSLFPQGKCRLRPINQQAALFEQIDLETEDFCDISEILVLDGAAQVTSALVHRLRCR